MVHRLRAVALAFLAAATFATIAPATAAWAAPDSSAASGDLTGARSVLIISLPATAWVDLRGARPPHLTRLLRHSALANLATRTVRNRTLAGAGYMALGAGGRAVADPADAAINLEAAERYQGVAAGAVFAVRTGATLGNRVGALGWPQLTAQNNALSYDTKVGALGRALTGAGIGRYAVANGDETDVTGPTFHREAALTLVDESGRVPGTVTGILQRDPRAPYGQRLDIDAVDRAFPADFSSRRQVVMVEASDLARADDYRPMATPEQRAALHAQALARTDELVGRLLAHVDLRRDAVVVVSPYHTSRTRTLTALAVHAPAVSPGLLESATTRRAGFVQIVDVAPTILDLLGVKPPDVMEGRPARLHPESGTYRDRIDRLVRADRAAQFRDATIGQTTAILVVVTIVLAVAAALWFRYARGTPATLVLTWASLGLIGYVTATFLAGLLPFFKWGQGPYFVFVVAVALTIAAIALAFGRRNPVDPLLIALGIVVLMHVGDLVSGTRLQFNTVFGYSPTVGIRLAGIGNPGSAQVSICALLFAILITGRVARRGAAIGDTVLVVTLLAIGAPMWGQDYGGALALAPTIVLWWLLHTRRRIHWRTVFIILGVLVVTGLVAGFVDLSRPANEQTHVGRFFHKVGEDGPSAFFSVIGRKLGLMIGTFSNTAWVLLVLSVVVVALLAFLRTDVMARIFTRVPALRPGLVCVGVLIVLATALNDSGVQVTGMMGAMTLAAIVFLATRFADTTDPMPLEPDDTALDAVGAPAGG
jgi:hypothetical protein